MSGSLIVGKERTVSEDKRQSTGIFSSMLSTRKIQVLFMGLSVLLACYSSLCVLDCYRTLKPTYYIVFVISVSGLYVLVTFYAVSQQMSEHGNQLLLCAVPDPVISQRTTNLIFQLSTGLMNAIAVSIYVAVWIGLRLGRHITVGTKRAFKALFAISFSLLCSWVAGAIGQLILMLIDANPQQFFLQCRRHWSLYKHCLCE
ncbi:hypothetical protein M3Y98_00912600 [Aphelenchoides besseyi]|nr:hypothetical protein M3Y98_00912600 [Aphelenchoides besseyi]